LFGRVKDAFSNLTKKLSEAVAAKELSPEDIDRAFDEVELSLLEGDVAYEVVDMLRELLKKELVGLKIKRFGNAERVVKERIAKVIGSLLARGAAGKDLVDLVREGPKPYIIVFMGVNGVGKTTTIAKVAHLLMKNKLRPVIVAADTFRAGAQEQLELHAKRLGIDYIKGKYGADPAAVAKDGVIHAEKAGLDAVLIDTAGRMHTDKNLMEEIRKVARVVRPHLKLMVLDALTGNDAVAQARWFDEAVGVDAVILTKLDADAKGGSALSIILSIGKPIMYVGVGQGYDDLKPYDPGEILNKLLGQ
jgi:fused signal recognition particle receptor